jgi:hypothetical protein
VKVEPSSWITSQSLSKDVFPKSWSSVSPIASSFIIFYDFWLGLELKYPLWCFQNTSYKFSVCENFILIFLVSVTSTLKPIITSKVPSSLNMEWIFYCNFLLRLHYRVFLPMIGSLCFESLY